MGVARNIEGHLEVFARGSDGKLWHTRQTAASAGPWTTFAKLGGSISFHGGPTVVSNKDGRLEIYCRGADSKLWRLIQTSLDNFASWEPLDRNISGDPAAIATPIAVNVFLTDWEGAVWHGWQARKGKAWVWAQRGDSADSQPVVCQNEDDRLEIFVRRRNGEIWHAWQTAPDAEGGNWVPMQHFASSAKGIPSVVRSVDGRMEMFYESANDELSHLWQTAQSNGWNPTPGIFSGLSGGDPVAIRNKDGRLEIFRIGPLNEARLHQNWQLAPNAGWSGWRPMAINTLRGPLCVEMNGDGRLEVFAIDDNTGHLLNMWQSDSSSGPWHHGNLGGTHLGGIGVRLEQLGPHAGWFRGS